MRLQVKLISIALSLLFTCHPGESQRTKSSISITSCGLRLITSGISHIENSEPPGEQILHGFSQINQLEENSKLPQTQVIDGIRDMINHTDTLQSLITCITNIHKVYDDFQQHIKGSSNENMTKNFAQACLSHNHTNNNDALPIHELYTLVTSNKGRSTNLFEVLIENQSSMDDAAKICDTTISSQQQVYRLYHMIALAMVKGHLMKIYAYHLLTKFDNQEYVEETLNVKQDYQRMMTKIEEIARNVMMMSSSDLRRCDPKVHKEGKTFVQLKWLFGRVIMNEIYLNEWHSCTSICGAYNEAKVYAKNWRVPPHHRCNGNIYNCILGTGSLYCPATKNYRYFDGLQQGHAMFDNRIDIGNANCSAVELWGKYRPSAAILSTCDDCICTCDDFNSPATVRTFSTKTVTSDKHSNWVITGVRFVEVMRVIHIQIQHGRLGPYGIVDESTVQWKSIDVFDYTDRFTPPSDYFTVKNGNNTMYLNTFFGYHESVLTGIGFMKYNDNTGIILQIETTEFDYETGILDNSYSRVSTPRDYEWHELGMESPHIPTLADTENIVNTERYLSVKFGQTDWTKDAAQTAIPFIDIQPIESKPPSPLSGAGLVYKGVPGYGGFFSLKLVSYNYSELLKP